MQQPLSAGIAPEAGAESLDVLMADLVRGTDASIGLLYLLPPDERVLWLTLMSGVSLRVAAPWVRAPLDGSGPLVDAINQRHVVWLRSQEEMAHRYPHLGIVVPYTFLLIAVPLVSGDRVWGGIVLLWPIWHPPQLSPRESEAITAFCLSAAHVLEEADARGRPLLPPQEPRLLPAPEPQAVPEHATAALRFTGRLPVGCCELDLDGRVTFINPAGADLMGTDSTSLVGTYPWEVLRWLNGPAFEDRYRSAVISRSPASFTAVRPPDTPLSFALYPSGSGISVHITPAAEQDAQEGGQQDPAQAGTGPREPAPPPPADGQVGAMGLYHLTHLSAALSEAVGVRDVVDLVTEQIVPAFGPQGLVLFTIEEGRLHSIGRRGYSTEFIDNFDDSSLDSDTPTARTLANNGPTFFSTFADFQRAYPHALRYRGRSAWAFMPLTTSGRPIGSLVLSYDRPRPFSPAERATLTSLSGLIAQALDRARLYDATHDLARTLQTGLLPRTLPRVPALDIATRYLPAEHGTDIGGDFYDLIQAKATVDPAATTPVVTAVIGDVQGHNTAAAALMGQVRTAVHACATAGTPPGELLARTNCLLTDIDVDLLTSCMIAQLDLRDRRVTIASAGHPPPLLRHADGDTEVLRVPPGPLLGIESAAEYPTTDITLRPGSVLTLYTDGLVETPGTDIDDAIDALARRLGQDRNRHLDTLADSLVRHTEPSALSHDDVALLLLRLRSDGDNDSHDSDGGDGEARRRGHAATARR